MNFTVSKGAYLGQLPPGSIPEKFAPGVVSTDHQEHSSPTFSPDGTEIYWSLWRRPDEGLPQVIVFVRQEGKRWSKPQTASFSGTYSDGGPVLSQDGQRLYFYSKRPSPRAGKIANNDIWSVQRTPGGWSTPQNIGSPVNTKRLEAAPSVTMDGTLYFVGYHQGVAGEMGIHRSKCVDGQYMKPEALDVIINSQYHDWTPYIAPDESYLVFSSTRPGGYGAFDLYIAFRKTDGGWTEAQNMGSEINTEASERFPGVSPDGKYLFFTRDSDIYWVDSMVIEQLRPR